MIVLTRGNVDVSVDIDVAQAVSGSIPCNGFVKWVPVGVMFTGVLESGVFGSFCIVDRQSERMSVHNIPLSRCMYRRSCYMGGTPPSPLPPILHPIRQGESASFVSRPLTGDRYEAIVWGQPFPFCWVWDTIVSL